MCISTQRQSQSSCPAPAAFGPEDLLSKAPEVRKASSSKCNKRSRNKHAKHPHIIVQHNYHDHSTEQAPMNLAAVPSIEQDAGGNANNIRGGVSTPFPLKLYEMLERVDQDGYGHIVSWQPHGRCFVVHKPDLFKELLPKYFKLSKIASFQRQLNLYGFVRLTRGMDKGGYYNELFLRGKPFLAHRIQRVKVKGTGVRARSNPEQEPDFWGMSWMASDNNNNNNNNFNVDDSNDDDNTKRNTSATPAEQPVVTDHSSTTTPRSTSPTNSSPVRGASFAAKASLPKMASSSGLDLEPLCIASTQDNDDIVLQGWGKPFHYLEAIQPLMQNMARFPKKQPQQVPQQVPSSQSSVVLPGQPLQFPGKTLRSGKTLRPFPGKTFPGRSHPGKTLGKTFPGRSHTGKTLPFPGKAFRSGQNVQPFGRVAPLVSSLEPTPVATPSSASATDRSAHVDLSGMDDVLDNLDFDELVHELFDREDIAFADLLDKVTD